MLLFTVSLTALLLYIYAWAPWMLSSVPTDGK